MRSYVERAKDFIATIFPLIQDCQEPYDYRKVMERFNHRYSRHVIVSNGLARVALITSDYVVKIEYDEAEVENIGGCEREIAMYAIAKAEGFAYLFAEITRYEYNGHIFYIMPRVYGIGKYEYDYANEHMTNEENEFCERHDITDLHSHNYGWRGDHVCLVDYACRLWHSSSPSQE